MCGIFAYLNHCTPKKRQEIIDILLQGLRRMEYRGYDSAGLLIHFWTLDYIKKFPFMVESRNFLTLKKSYIIWYQLVTDFNFQKFPKEFLSRQLRWSFKIQKLLKFKEN